jgi:hypothetical protein
MNLKTALFCMLSIRSIPLQEAVRRLPYSKKNNL